jgi:nicotinamidase-related amidase
MNMQNIGDNHVYNSVDEIIDPSHTALVVWDVQNMLVNRIFNKDEFTTKIKSVIGQGRKSNVPIFFTRIQRLPLYFDSPARIYAFSKLGFDRLQQPTEEDIAFAIKPELNEIILDKYSGSIFIGTIFEQMLRNAGIVTIVFTGIATEFGIESCARDAFNRGFYPVVISDCVSSPDKMGHERSLENMKKLVTIINSTNIENYWTSISNNDDLRH